MAQDYADKFKKYVPSEVLAAFVALNTLMPVSQTGTWLYLAAGAVVTVVFVTYAITARMFKNPLILLLVGLSVPLWGASSATARLEEEFSWFETAKFASLAFLVIVSLVLTLFEPRRDGQSGAGK